MILVDRLILDFKDVENWVSSRNGQIQNDAYASALPRSTSIMFEGDFEDAQNFLKLDGVRRALIAYWTEGLIGLKERGVLSVFSKHHNWNAVAEIHSRLMTNNN